MSLSTFIFKAISDDTFRDRILSEIPDAGAGLNTGLLVAGLKLKEWLDYSRDEALDLLLPIANEGAGGIAPGKLPGR
jgi:hypothetical protein